jgi:RimJ/RimL family protein N-acetyltransferase
MTEQPTIRTERLVLRPFTPADAPDVQRLAGDRDIAATTATIPHPYPDGAAEAWIATHPEKLRSNEGVTFAVVRREDGALAGCIGLVLQPEHERAELGYWIGKPYWGLGYATEAARAVLRYGFETLGLNRVYANYMGSNPASGRVMQKIGMVREGCKRQHTKKWGALDDLVMYGILHEEWQRGQAAAKPAELLQGVSGGPEGRPAN